MLLAMLFLPVYDALRVFVIRLSKKISPLKADRTHIHYRLLDAGMSHSGAVLVIGLAHVVLLAIVWVLQDVHPFILIGIMTAFSLVLSFVIARIRQKHQHTIA
jgi:UDP-GlcNAc:undecaprenyl-phosphate/decaprenyl-phosphate GlcNAc-1-phosphate transferase